MTKRSRKIRFYGILRLTTAVIILWTPSTGAQDQPKQMLTSKEKAWKAHVFSELFSEKGMANLRARIEQGQIVCRSGGSAVLEIPLKSSLERAVTRSKTIRQQSSRLKTKNLLYMLRIGDHDLEGSF
jgi:hypothetical protein